MATEASKNLGRHGVSFGTVTIGRGEALVEFPHDGRRRAECLLVLARAMATLHARKGSFYRRDPGDLRDARDFSTLLPDRIAPKQIYSTVLIRPRRRRPTDISRASRASRKSRLNAPPRSAPSPLRRRTDGQSAPCLLIVAIPHGRAFRMRRHSTDDRKSKCDGPGIDPARERGAHAGFNGMAVASKTNDLYGDRGN